MHTIVVGYIRTPEGQAAIDAATDLALKDGARLVLVTTATGDALVDPRYVDDEHFRDVGRRLTERGVAHALIARMSADPARDVLEVAEAENAALIVIGLRRRTSLGKFIMGSNAQRILLDATCPVLSVKAAPPTE